jgi:hypothetical protein
LKTHKKVRSFAEILFLTIFKINFNSRHDFLTRSGGPFRDVGTTENDLVSIMYELTYLAASLARLPKM